MIFVYQKKFCGEGCIEQSNIKDVKMSFLLVKPLLVQIEHEPLRYCACKWRNCCSSATYECTGVE